MMHRCELLPSALYLYLFLEELGMHRSVTTSDVVHRHFGEIVCSLGLQLTQAQSAKADTELHIYRTLFVS